MFVPGGDKFFEELFRDSSYHVATICIPTRTGTSTSIRFVARDKDAVRLLVHSHIVRILVSSPNSVSRTLLAST